MVLRPQKRNQKQFRPFHCHLIHSANRLIPSSLDARNSPQKFRTHSLFLNNEQFWSILSAIPSARMEKRYFENVLWSSFAMFIA